MSRAKHDSRLYLRTMSLFLATALIGLQAATPQPSQAQSTKPMVTKTWPKRVQPSWINNGLVMVGNWEPLQWIYRKNWQNWGNAMSGQQAEAIFREERSEQTVVALKEMGVNLVLTSFHKGFGIANEKASMDDARAYGKLLHKHGLKMGVLVDMLLIYEELYAEFPDSKNWHRVLYDGTPDVYDNDGYRYRPFLNNPEFISYIKQVCKQAVDAGADWIHFDIVNQTPENFHPVAQQMFREWLKARYPTTESWYFRSGLHYWDYVKVPHYSDPLSFETYDQPIMQEYLIFKSQLLADYAAEMSTYIRSLNPEIAVDWVTQGITGDNRIMLNNMDFPRVLPWLDSYWSEDADIPRYTDDGRLVSKIRSLKMAQQYNDVMFAYTGPNPAVEDRVVDTQEGDPRLLLAESMAFNRQSLGEVGDPLVYKTFPGSGHRYIKFFWKNFDLLAKAPTAADVAVLRGFTSLAYNNFAPHREVGLAEQTLIQAQIPFDMIDDHNLTDLSKYRVVVLADQDSMSDEQVAAVREYVRKGGGLVATADTARFDDWRRDRGKSGLSDVLGFDERGAKRSEPRQNQFGSGRAAFLPELTPQIAVPKRSGFTAKYWAPASNGKQFANAVRWAAGGKLTWEITSPSFVATETYYQPDRNRYILHLVNYNFRRSAPGDITVSIHTQDASAITKITQYSPDQGVPAELKMVRTADALTFTVPSFDVYTIIAIQK
jgi:hypothetical protein